MQSVLSSRRVWACLSLSEPVTTSTCNYERSYCSCPPFRYDDTRFNKSISKLNSNLDCKIFGTHFSTLNLNNFNFRHHTRHGIHFNQTGKEMLCKLMANKIKMSPFNHMLMTRSPTASLICDNMFNQPNNIHLVTKRSKRRK